MKLLLTRFSLFLVMMIGIAGTSYVQGGSEHHDYAASPVACSDEIVALTSADALPVGKEKRSAGQRLIRWQSLLPGTFR